jgi:hypothetical protein
MASYLTTTGAAQAMAAVSGPYFLGLGTGKDSAGLIGEPSGGSYTRVSVSLTVTGASGTNAAEVTVPATTVAFSGLTHAGLFTTITGGSCIWVGPLVNAVTLGPGSPVTIAVGSLTVGIAVTS